METDKFIPLSEAITLPEDALVMKNTFSEHSDEIEEIISKKPPFIVRWGTVFLFFLLLMIGLICWFIQYPDIVATKAKLTSLNAPKTIISRTDGKLIKLKITEGDIVHTGTIIGFMESISDHEQVLALSAKIDSMSNLFTQNKTLLLPKFVFETYRGLGELQHIKLFHRLFLNSKAIQQEDFTKKRKKYLKMIYQILNN